MSVSVCVCVCVSVGKSKVTMNEYGTWVEAGGRRGELGCGAICMYVLICTSPSPDAPIT